MFGFVAILGGGVLLYFLTSPALKFVSLYEDGKVERLEELYNRKIKGRLSEEKLLRSRMKGKVQATADDYLLEREGYEVTMRKLNALKKLPLYFLENELFSCIDEIEEQHDKETANAVRREEKEESTSTSESSSEEKTTETTTEKETETTTEKETETTTEKETETTTEKETETTTEEETEPEPETSVALTSFYYTVTRGGVQTIDTCRDIYGNVYRNVLAGTESNVDNTLEYTLNGNYRTFTGTIIRDSEAKLSSLIDPSRTDITVTVYGDGQFIYRSVSANLRGGEYQEFTLNVEGVRKLKVVINGKNFIRLCNAELW